MKKIVLLFCFALCHTLSSMAQEPSVSDVEDSGCLSHAPGDDGELVPTIVLTKEGDILSVQVLNYESNCGTRGFDVTSSLSGGSDNEPYSLSVGVEPVVPAAMDCICPFNVTFTIRDLKPNSFYLKCWWYEGQVELTEGEPLVLEDVWEDAIVGDAKYTLRKTLHKAMLADGSTMKGEVNIPSELSYEGQNYVVTSISESAFNNNKNLTKVTIPQTIKDVGFDNSYGLYSSLFYNCTSLESIEVEKDNPVFCSVDGVLFNKEQTTLISYPANASRTSYDVPEGVANVAINAFAYSQQLKKVTLPDDVTTLYNSVFANSKSLEEVTLSASLQAVKSRAFLNCQHLKSIIIPQSITSIGNRAFSGCNALQALDFPESVCDIDYNVFDGCKLNTLYIRGILKPYCMNTYLFGGMGTETEVYVQPSEVERYKAIYEGPVYPISDDTNGISEICHSAASTIIYNLQGQRLNSAPQKGVYIQNGKKVVVK